MELCLVESISHETVHLTLKKNELKPWRKKSWRLPQANAEFVARMEDVLELYEQPYDPRYPLVCFDETSKQLIAETRASLPPRPWQVARYDYEYRRNGVRNLFVFFEPLATHRFRAYPQCELRCLTT